jgi:hypothetical protein
MIARCNSDGNDPGDGSDAACSVAQMECNSAILTPLSGKWDVYDVRTQNPDSYPPAFGSLFTTSFMKTIGAESTWQISNDDVY